jgi:type IV secretory pathway TrbL component
MKKVIIAIIVGLILLYFALRTETVQDLFDRLTKRHQVELIQ